MNVRKTALIAIMSAAAIAIAYSKGLTASFLPGLIDFLTVIIFVNGFCFGPEIGGTIGAITMSVKMLIPYPFAHPAAWLFTISPILLIIEAALGAVYGVVGGFLGRRWNPSDRKLGFVLRIALAGFTITFVYQILSSIGFYIAFPIYNSVWEALYLTFIPLYYPYPPIALTLTNTIVFAVVGPTLIHAIKNVGVKP